MKYGIVGNNVEQAQYQTIYGRTNSGGEAEYDPSGGASCTYQQEHKTM